MIVAPQASRAGIGVWRVLACLRAERLVVAMNPGLNTETITVPAQGDKANDPTVLLCLGNAQARGSEVTLGPQSFVIVHV